MILIVSGTVPAPSGIVSNFNLKVSDGPSQVALAGWSGGVGGTMVGGTSRPDVEVDFLLMWSLRVVAGIAVRWFWDIFYHM